MPVRILVIFRWRKFFLRDDSSCFLRYARFHWRPLHILLDIVTETFSVLMTLNHRQTGWYFQFGQRVCSCWYSTLNIIVENRTNQLRQRGFLSNYMHICMWHNLTRKSQNNCNISSKLFLLSHASGILVVPRRYILYTPLIGESIAHISIWSPNAKVYLVMYHTIFNFLTGESKTYHKSARKSTVFGA